MKISGIEMDGQVHEALLVIPHRDKSIPFLARAIESFDEFNKLCPEPVPPTALTSNGKKILTDDPSYREMLATHNTRRVCWMVITSLQDIEWDTVVSDKPSTWDNWEEDMKSNGFSSSVIGRIVNHVMEVNMLDESKLELARKNFALGLAVAEEKSSGQTTEPQTTLSGTPAAE